jgi:DNA-binding transcriptional ArsR family regulator
LVKERDSFSTEELLQVLTYSKDELTEALPNITIREESGWVCIVEKHGEKWTIEQSLELLPKPSLVSDIYDKLLFGISLLSKDSRSDFATDEISNIIQASEREDTERILRRLHFQKHGDIWKLPAEILKNPESVIERIELPLRLSPGFAASQCLSFIDANSLSLTELSEITKVDKSTISRTLKRLSEADLIVLMKRKGPFGELYYITNCDNCPFGKDKEECRSEAVKLIEKTMKELVPSLTIPEIDWQRFSNHSLVKLATELGWFKVEKDVKADIKDYKELCSQVLRPLLSPILDTLEKRAILMANEQGWVDKARIMSSLDEKGKELPFLYFLGVKQTVESNLVSAALESLSKEKEK